MNLNFPLIQRVRASEHFVTPGNLFLKLLIFLLVFLFYTFAEMIPIILFFIPRLMDWAMPIMEKNGMIADDVMMEKINGMLTDPFMTKVTLFATGLGTIVILLFCRFVEGRKLNTMGFRKKGAALHYLLGLGVGFVMFSMVVLLSYLMGGLQWNGYQGFSWMVLVALLGYGIQGMSEEVMCRGYLMTTVLRHQNVWWAVAVNSVVFGILHGGNAGFSLLAFINLVLYAVMISFYMLRTDNLWGACAIHSIWNFVQGNFYGLPVSGIDSGETIFSMSLQGSALANGGTFGLEASLPTTIVMTAAIALLLFVPGKKQEKAETE